MRSFFSCPMLVNHKMQKRTFIICIGKVIQKWSTVFHQFAHVACSTCHRPVLAYIKIGVTEKFQSASQTSFSLGVFLYVLGRAVEGLPVSAEHDGSTISVASRNMGTLFFYGLKIFRIKMQDSMAVKIRRLWPSLQQHSGLRFVSANHVLHPCFLQVLGQVVNMRLQVFMNCRAKLSELPLKR